MSAPPRVSVVMPFMNVGRFLAEAVESVRAQSYDAWELLLADDGATDGGSETAREYAARDPTRIRYLEHPGHENRGASAARNLALRHAHGEYVAFLDGDDAWFPNKLAEQVPIFDAHPGAGMMYGNTEYWYSWDAGPGGGRPDSMSDLRVPPGTTLQPPELLTRILRGTAAAPCTCSVLARRDLVERVGGFEDSFRRIYTDQVFYAKMLIAAPVFVVDQCWDRYRRHADSAVATVRAAGEQRLAHRTFLEWVARYVEERGVRDPALRAALREELWRVRHPRLVRLVAPLSRAIRGRGR